MNYKEYLIDYFNPIPGRLHDSGVKIMLQIKEKWQASDNWNRVKLRSWGFGNWWLVGLTI